MIRLPSDPSDDEVLAVVRDWVAALASGDAARAYALTAHDPYYNWTPDVIISVIAGYGLPEPAPDGVVHRVPPILDAVGEFPPRHEVDRHDEPVDRGAGRLSLGIFYFDLPLDGSWSDLTATFDIIRDAQGAHLVLNEIHVF